MIDRKGVAAEGPACLLAVIRLLRRDLSNNAEGFISLLLFKKLKLENLKPFLKFPKFASQNRFSR